MWSEPTQKSEWAWERKDLFMTRAQAKQKLIDIGIAEPTEEQISALLDSVTDETKAEKVLFVKFYASTFFTLFVPIIHKFFIIMRIPCSQFFKLFSTSRNQLYTQFQDRYHFKSCTEIYSQISNK